MAFLHLLIKTGLKKGPRHLPSRQSNQNFETILRFELGITHGNASEHI